MATIEAAKRLAELGFFVFPVRVNGKRPAVTRFYERATKDFSDIEKLWGSVDYNIGISTTNFEGGGLLVVDIDVKHDGFSTLGFLEDIGLSFPETLCAKTAGGGRHMFYRVPEAVSQSAGTLLGRGLDTRSYHGYVVGPGSIIEGKSYQFENLAGVAEAPEWLIEKHKRAPKIHPGLRLVEDVNEELAERRAIEFLERLDPAEEGQRNHKCFAAAAKIKDFGLSRDRAGFVMSAYWKSEPALGAEEIEATVTAAYNYGQNTIGIDSPEAAFDVIPLEPKPKPQDPLSLMNEEYAFVVAGGGAQILWTKPDFDGHIKTEYLGYDGWVKKLSNKKIFFDGKERPISKAWMEWEHRKSYDGIVFEPNKNNPRHYNRWQGFAVKPLATKPTAKAEAALALFQDHILRNICEGNQEHYNWVMGWFAHIFQKPEQKARTAFVLRGKKGTGKSAIFDILRRCLGQHFMSTANKRFLTGNFNAHLEDKILLLLEEAFWSGDKSTDGILKEMITGETHMIERKGIEAYAVKNLCRVAILGNEEWVVPATDDERRYAVFDIGEANRGDDDFFGRMKDDMDHGLLLKFFLEFDLGCTNINKVPDTKALLAQKEHTQEPFKKWWRDSLREGRLMGSGTETWPTEVGKEDFRSAFILEVNRQKITGRLPSEPWIGRHLKQVAPSLHSIRLGTGDARRRFYQFPTLAQARAEWEAYIGHEVDWEVEDDGEA